MTDALSAKKSLLSRPVRARGLKHIYTTQGIGVRKSRPVRARGLKPVVAAYLLLVMVAPCAGAWIETVDHDIKKRVDSRALCGRVD